MRKLNYKLLFSFNIITFFYENVYRNSRYYVMKINN